MLDQTMIHAIATTARTVIESHWAGWRGWILPAELAISTGACHITSTTLLRVFPRLISAEWHVASGSFDGRGHSWLRAKADDRRLIIDITADQFGAERIIVTPSDCRYHEITIYADPFIPPQDRKLVDQWAAMIWQQIVDDHPSYVQMHSA
jgi:hypothetical protein